MHVHRIVSSALVVPVFVLALVLAPQGCAQEHPTEHPSEHPSAGNGSAAQHEHPSEQPPAGSGSAKSHEHPAEHPEHRTAKAPSRGVSMAQLAKAIEDYVARESSLKGGSFQVHDPEEDRMLSLKLTKVHRDRLARMSSKRYFACADFTNEDGTVYDLDLFMTGNSPATLKPSEITVHKKDGKARYNWKEVRGNWVKEPVE